jgi:hypothetical protein
MVCAKKLVFLNLNSFSFKHWYILETVGSLLILPSNFRCFQHVFGYFCGFDSLLNYVHLETILLTRLRFSTFLHPKSR